MVSGGGWHATSGACALVEAALRAVSVVRGAGGDRAMSRAGPRGTRGGPPAGAGGLDVVAGRGARGSGGRRAGGGGRPRRSRGTAPAPPPRAAVAWTPGRRPRSGT